MDDGMACICQGIWLIGYDERINRSSIEALARTSLFRQVIIIVIPPQLDNMHIDTVLSIVGKHTFTLHSLLAN
ncbi:unnamed protein product [Rotaria sp. Silwood1]|nr:unnamed protein product [Rotaria sp. Silwood1]CAF1159195.1 unnamed protein product [Rotaria sp. Silwood1]CAF3426940.1 unnamed protein product [Rotaria sp. Silwood1]CAF3435450.1 unnamed protein product [Rotaria sp. Silwood1]CAF3440271.1 unnamed protein product [Rotaria sp. Silwood1]